MHQIVSATATGQLVTGPGSVIMINVYGGGSSGNFTIYDNTAASGAVIARLGAGANLHNHIFFGEAGAIFGKGLYVHMNGGAGLHCNVAYDQ